MNPEDKTRQEFEYTIQMRTGGGNWIFPSSAIIFVEKIKVKIALGLAKEEFPDETFRIIHRKVCWSKWEVCENENS